MSAHTPGLTNDQVLAIAEKYGEFMYGDAQGHKRIEFAAEIVAARERIRDAAPDLLAALKAILSEVVGPEKPYSSDSWLPAHLVKAACSATAKAEGRE